VAGKEKPYRVYRAGRARGPIKPLSPKERPRLRPDGDGKPPTDTPRVRRRRPWARIVVFALLGVVLLAIVLGFLGFLAIRSGVKAANARLDDRSRRALAPGSSIWSGEQNTVVLGTDKGPGKGRTGPGRSDAIMVVHTDAHHHRIAMLSIPRDLRVDIPGHGTDKINAAYALGGPALTVKTVQAVTGLKINHLVLVDFASFGDVIDALGGITVNVSERIRSNRFDCPFSSQARCDRWPGWRFHKGPQHMNGHRALIYSRIRENALNPGESDITRGGHQQQVLQAIEDKLVSFGSYLRMPFIGDNVLKPLTTDLSTMQLLQLAWVKKRSPASQQIKCRLGGTATTIGGVDYIIGTEENVSVIAMVTGQSAPQPPPPGSGPFGPGCVVAG